MRFPRRPAAESWQHPQYGVPLIGDGRHKKWHISITSDGEIYELDPPTTGAKNIESLIKAANMALRNAMRGGETRWWENGVDIGTAINQIPTDIATDAQTERLRTMTLTAPGRLELEFIDLGMATRSAVEVHANAVPEITGIDLRQPEAADLKIFLCDLRKQLRVAIQSAMRCRKEFLEDEATDPLANDVKAYQWLRSYLETYFENKVRLDENSMILMMPVGNGAQAQARVSLPRLLTQATAAGKRTDVLLGLNDGAVFWDVDDVVAGQDADVFHLCVNEMLSTGTSGGPPFMPTEDVFLNGEPFVMGAAPNERHRVFVIHQMPTGASAGKNRLQKLLCRMLFDRIVLGEGEAVPATMFLADTDTLLYEKPPMDNDAVQDGSSGALGKLFSDMQERNLELVAARGHFTRFTGNADRDGPDFEKPIPEIYTLLDSAHGTNLNHLHGGATLGRLPQLLSLLSVICHRYPGSRNEDLHYTILSRAGGTPSGISMNCVATNRVHSDPRAQLERWFSAAAALRKHYGNEAFKGIHKGKHMLEEAKARGISQATIDEHLALIQFGKEHPDDLRGNAEWNG